MAHGLEQRVPFLSKKVIEVAQRIPTGLKFQDQGKMVLRDAMSPILGPAAYARKQGFSAPDGEWFRVGSGSEYLSSVLFSPHAVLWDYLDREVCTSLLAEHAQGASNHRLLIWSLLAFEGWLKEFT
jgi:asparagine synthase (glutamine-hydrolysing)